MAATGFEEACETLGKKIFEAVRRFIDGNHIFRRTAIKRHQMLNVMKAFSKQIVQAVRYFVQSGGCAQKSTTPQKVVLKTLV
ncbi:MAG: hypothetical protein WDN00_00785 [Limisphaerales bacterium]